MLHVIVALFVLFGEVAMGTPLRPRENSPNHQLPLAPLIGGIVGGVIVISIPTILLIIWLRRKGRRSRRRSFLDMKEKHQRSRLRSASMRIPSLPRPAKAVCKEPQPSSPSPAAVAAPPPVPPIPPIPTRPELSVLTRVSTRRPTSAHSQRTTTTTTAPHTPVDNTTGGIYQSEKEVGPQGTLKRVVTLSYRPPSRDSVTTPLLTRTLKDNFASTTVSPVLVDPADKRQQYVVLQQWQTDNLTHLVVERSAATTGSPSRPSTPQSRHMLVQSPPPGYEQDLQRVEGEAEPEAEAEARGEGVTTTPTTEETTNNDSAE